MYYFSESEEQDYKPSKKEDKVDKLTGNMSSKRQQSSDLQLLRLLEINLTLLSLVEQLLGLGTLRFESVF